MATLNFNANQVDPSVEFEAIPAGKYIAIVAESQMKPTKSGNGSYLELVFQVLEGQYKGRKLWARLNLDNPNPTTAKIAQAELSAICRATGVMTRGNGMERGYRSVGSFSPAGGTGSDRLRQPSRGLCCRAPISLAPCRNDNRMK